MGYNARNDEIRENLERMRREPEAYEDKLVSIPKISSGADSRNEAESAHHSTRCLRSFTCL